MPPGYTIRFCTPVDLEPVTEMMKTVFLGLDEYGELTHMLLDGSHASARPEHCVVAVDDSTGQIVSAVPCAPQMYSYGGLPFPVWNMIIVGTLEEHREKGLMRALFEALLEKARGGGAQAVVVFGIAGFYRKLGMLPILPYWGGRVFSAAHLRRKFPRLEVEPLALRQVTLSDLPFLADLHACAARRWLVSFPYDQAYWKLAAFDYFERNRDQVRLVQSEQGRPLGALIHAGGGGDQFTVITLELAPGVSWLESLPPVIRAVLAVGEEYARAAGEPSSLEGLYLALGPTHPAYDFLADVPSRPAPHTCGYLRLTDLPAFLRSIAPLLEERIAHSPLVGYTRTVRIELYYRPEGLFLRFEDGKLVEVRGEVIEGYRLVTDRAEIEMPEEDFISLLMGQHSIDDIAHHYREVNTWNWEDGLAPEFRILMRVLFPRAESFIYPCV